MQRASFSDMHCSIARALEVVGEWWTLLIVRDALRGATRFEEFQKSLGIARNILTVRLKTLTEAGVMQRQLYQTNPERYEYVLTPKGEALFPVLTTIMRWGDVWEAGPAGPPLTMRHQTCGHVTTPILTCDHCHEPIAPQDFLTTAVPAAS